MMRSISMVLLECFKSCIGNINILISSRMYLLQDVLTQFAIDPRLFFLDRVFNNRFAFTYPVANIIFENILCEDFYYLVMKTGLRRIKY